jgi:hypothetical protein
MNQDSVAERENVAEFDFFDLALAVHLVSDYPIQTVLKQTKKAIGINLLPFSFFTFAFENYLSSIGVYFKSR